MAYPGIAGKVAIVTGAAGGIGQALVAGFVNEGLRVAALDIDEKGVRALQEKYGEAKVLALRVDVSDAEDCRRQWQRPPGSSEPFTFSSTTRLSA